MAIDTVAALVCLWDTVSSGSYLALSSALTLSFKCSHMVSFSLLHTFKMEALKSVPQMSGLLQGQF